MTKVSRTEFRDAMARVTSPVSVVTTDGEAGRGGFTATAMCSVTDEPPTVLVCMNARSAQTELFQRNGRYCVNVLPTEHKELAALFAGASQNMEERYAQAEWDKLKSGLPVLRGAIVAFDCEIVDIHRVGTHNIMIGAVRDIRHRTDGSALLYYDRSYVHVNSRLGNFGG